MATVQDYTLSNTTPTLIASGVGELYVQMLTGGITLYLGDSSVTTTTGLAVPATATTAPGFRMHLGSTDEICAVASVAGYNVRVMQTR